MINKPIKILLVEDNPADAKLIRLMLLESPGTPIELEFSDCLSSGLERIGKGGIDLILLDLNLPNSQGFETFTRLYSSSPNIPIVVLTGSSDSELAVNSVKAGAQDYLVKDEITSGLLVRAVRYALERKQSEKNLRESEIKYRTLVEQMPAIVYIAALDELSSTLYISPQVEDVLGYSPEDYKADPDIWRKKIHPDDYERVMDEVVRSQKSGKPLVSEYRMLNSSGYVIWFHDEARIVRDESGNPLFLQGVMIDITTRKRVEEALHNSIQQWHSTFDAINDSVAMINLEGNILRCNLAMTRLLGKSFNEILGHTCWKLIHNKEQPVENCPFTRMKESHKRETLVLQMGSNWLNVNVDPLFDDLDNLIGAVHIISDITAIKQAEDDLRKERDLISSIMDTSPAGITVVNREGQIVFANKQAEKVLGLKEDEITKRTYNAPSWRITDYDGNPFPEEELPFQRVMATGKPVYDVRHAIEWQDGRRVLLSINSAPLLDNSGQVVGMVATIEDISQRMRAEKKIAQLNRTYSVLSNINELIVRIRDRQKLLEKSCQIAVEDGNFLLAWIGIVEENSHLVKPIAWYGKRAEDYLSAIEISIDDIPIGWGPTGISIREKMHFICNDIERSEYMQPWREKALELGYRSSAAFPLIVDNRVICALSLYSSETNFFDEKEIHLLEELASDISYAIEFMEKEEERKGAEEKLKQSFIKLQKTLEGTVNALATTTEIKDPYTSGHQQRVAKLACAIAREMKFSDEKIEEIRVSALLHDIGKISVPAEILSKPGKLNTMEMSIIKTHSQVGHDILKTIEFPWPVAQIVLQHHEKMDGSGYPRGLKGENILMVSRILCVADVVEAMASNRPYRPALGIDKALEEIKKNKSILYDSDVVDTCLKCFIENKFEF